MSVLQSFSTFRARPFLAEQILRPVQTGRIVHAQLLAGPQGTGKHAAALLMARAVNCDGTGEKPCNVCPSCRQFLSGNSPRLIEIAPDGNSIKVDEIRKLIEKIHLRPESGFMCVVIDQADRMNEAAQNALLKTLEEAPEYALFFLVTEKASSLLPTIRSRCAFIRFAPLTDETVEQRLVEMGIGETQAHQAARNAAGSIGKAYRLLSDDSFLPLKQRATEALKVLKKKSNVVDAFQKIANDKDQAARILEIYEAYADRLMRAQTGAEEATDEDVKALLKVGVRGDRLMKAVVQCAKKLQVYVSYQSAMEMLFFDMVSQEDK